GIEPLCDVAQWGHLVLRIRADADEAGFAIAGGTKKRRSLSPTFQEVCENCKSGRARESPPRNRVPGWNRPAVVVECRACALSAAGKPEFGRGSYHRSICPFLCDACAGRAVTTAVRAASAISALRPIATKLVRRNELTRRADRVLAPLAIRPRRRQPLAAGMKRVGRP